MPYPGLSYPEEHRHRLKNKMRREHLRNINSTRVTEQISESSSSSDSDNDSSTSTNMNDKEFKRGLIKVLKKRNLTQETKKRSEGTNIIQSKISRNESDQNTKQVSKEKLKSAFRLLESKKQNKLTYKIIHKRN